MVFALGRRVAVPGFGAPALAKVPSGSGRRWPPSCRPQEPSPSCRPEPPARFPVRPAGSRRRLVPGQSGVAGPRPSSRTSRARLPRSSSGKPPNRRARVPPSSSSGEGHRRLVPAKFLVRSDELGSPVRPARESPADECRVSPFIPREPPIDEREFPCSSAESPAANSCQRNVPPSPDCQPKSSAHRTGTDPSRSGPLRGSGERFRKRRYGRCDAPGLWTPNRRPLLQPRNVGELALPRARHGRSALAVDGKTPPAAGATLSAHSFRPPPASLLPSSRNREPCASVTNPPSPEETGTSHTPPAGPSNSPPISPSPPGQIILPIGSF